MNELINKQAGDTFPSFSLSEAIQNCKNYGDEYDDLITTDDHLVRLPPGDLITTDDLISTNETLSLRRLFSATFRG